MAEVWNFHNYIAIPLEMILKGIGIIAYTADDIESGEFVDAMIRALSFKFDNSDNYIEFKTLCEKYINLPSSKIPVEEAKNIFTKFEKLMK